MIQERGKAISDILNFSDQSVFGKFFRKHSGSSPLDYIVYTRLEHKMLLSRLIKEVATRF